MAEIYLNDKRDDPGNDRNGYGGVMGIGESFEVAESANEPIVDICPSQRRLDGLYREDKID